MTRQATRRAVSLIELLVAMMIIAVLAGLILPAVQNVRAAAARAHCQERMHQIGLAFQNYYSAQGVLPPGASVNGKNESYRYMNWETRLLPYLEQDALWAEALEAYRVRPEEFRGPPHPTGKVVPAFLCPADPISQQPEVFKGIAFAFSSYLGVSGTREIRYDGVLYVDSRTRFPDITDGTSQTLLVGERPRSADGIFGWWYAGQGQNEDGSGDSVLSTGERAVSFWFSGCSAGRASFGPGRLENQCDALHFWSMHPGGAHFLFADGSVHFISYSAKDVLAALATRAGGESATTP